MKNIYLFIFFSFLSCYASEFILDKEHTFVNFKVRHMLISKSSGVFHDFDSMIYYDNGKFLVFNASVDFMSIDTKNQERDEKIKDIDFLNTQLYPNITFVMNEYIQKNSENDTMCGVLSINGVSKDQCFEVKNHGLVVIGDKTKLGFELLAEINRFDFDVAKNIGKNKISPTIEIRVYAEAYKNNSLSSNK